MLLLLVGAGRADTDKSSSAAFLLQQSELPAGLIERMKSCSWRPGCPVGLDELVLLRLSHWGLDGRVHTGELVVHRRLAGEIGDIFRDLFAARFPIEKMRLIEDYRGSDDASMADDNTSAFNCRRSASNRRVFSRHAWGAAIDINPLRNPYVSGRRVLPPGGRSWLDRSRPRPGMIVHGDAVWRAFTSRGWRWGGDFRHLKDFQHFEKRLPGGSGRPAAAAPAGRTGLACLQGGFPAAAPRLSLDEWRTPLGPLLERIARVARLNIVSAEGVAGRVTLKLGDVPWPRALDAVLCSLGLRGRRQGNVIFVEKQ
ncbi:MAG: hypothetical protein DRI34_05755 [Deltaproteobacteria bacterium]|nr:MAG: hypothetical protein DRI34_05755 [Deltaproteobacteria bacterium]